ncbi:MAG: acetoacetate--CoA ligase [Balneolaceae bacterium]|nr:acetoacetate--CoA ligase [Balneolaceae bacterium]MBO6545634.1 acetoacetate--CoA ligase [Balneolaceae bacterium]MBO6647030.1 acetoacetate--CoA ligase [Balneolaceae bacterium]
MSDQEHTFWSPSEDFVQNSNLKKYEDWLKQEKGLAFDSYHQLWEWSCSNIEDFWESLWEYFDVISHSDYDQVLNSHSMPGTNWFEGATLNYSEHIFRQKSGDRSALIFSNEAKETKTLSWDDFEQHVASAREFLIGKGISKGDTVSAYLPNTPEAIISFLAVNSLGAIWSCCSPDFGSKTVIDRFDQIKPKVFIACDGYTYGGKETSRINEVKSISSSISSIEHVVLVPSLNPSAELPGATLWQEVISNKDSELAFEPVDFSHPIWVLYSSGTTGKPKAITHSHGGVLLEHLKYMHFHNDVKPGENFFWFTTTGWMMWNFLQASLLAGATPVLFDGSPGYPDLNILWELSEQFPIHHFGTSAPYLVACMKKRLSPGSNFDLSYLRSIGSTGAPLPPEAFDWVYEHVSKDVWLCSMSGGTDVCTAFVGGIPNQPVYRGKIQGRALGCSLFGFDDDGNEVFDSLGEMVITEPMPSMPIYFWGDENHERYRSSYFDKFPGQWCHGDWINLSENGSLIIQGRSDATLNRKGIRIGTAEIYAVLNKISGIKDSLIVNLEREGGNDFMPLFVVLDGSSSLEKLVPFIISTLKQQCSPRHVPDEIFEVPDIPYTLSGKKMEVPVKKALLGMDVSKSMNKDASRNPEAMDLFIKLAGTF